MRTLAEDLPGMLDRITHDRRVQSGKKAARSCHSYTRGKEAKQAQDEIAAYLAREPVPRFYG